MSDKRHVFISYSRRDHAFVEKLRANLQAANVNVWIDTEGIRFGTPNWERAIRNAIDEAYAVIWVVSPDSYSSEYVQDELAIAKLKNCAVYPVWAAGDSWHDCVPLGMGRIQYIDARTVKGKDLYIDALPEIIGALHGSKPNIAVPTPAPKPLPAGKTPRNPYKGLNAFREEDVADFFGRENLAQTLYETLESRITNKQPRFLAVIGASGSGKSSVIMAGLLPKLRKNGWLHILSMIPGKKPLLALQQALGKVMTNRSITGIYDDLQHKSGLGLHLLASTLDSRALLFVDQFEEVFTLTESEDERAQFINLLTSAATEADGALTLVLTMRADYYDRPMNYAELGKLVQKYNESVLPMSIIELRDAIEKPALADDVSLTFEPELVGEIVFSLRDRRDALAGALPLMQFTLNQLYEKRSANTLTRAAYDEIGGVQGAIGHHADEVFNALPQEVQDALPRVAAKLVRVDETTTTRRRALLSEFDDYLPSQQLIETLVNERLLVTGKEEAAYVEVAHEALLTHWNKLVQSIDANKEGLRQLRRLEADAQEWERLGKPKDMQWSHERLAFVYKVQETLKFKLDLLTAEFAIPQPERLLQEFKSAPRYRRQAIIDEWKRIGEGAILQLFEALRYEREVNAYLKNNIVTEFRKFPKEALSVLFYALKDSDVYMRREAVWALDQLGDRLAVNPLIELLKDDDVRVKLASAEVLGKLGDRLAVNPLIELLGDTDIGVRLASAASLGALGDESTIDPLSELLFDPSDLVRRTAVRSLRQLGYQSTVTPLVNALKDQDMYVRRSAVEALGRLGDTQVVPSLIGILKDQEEEVRKITLQALSQLGDAHAIPYIIDMLKDKSRAIQRAAEEALKQLISAYAVPDLIDLLNDQEIELGSEAKQLLLSLKYSPTVRNFIDNLNSQDEIVIQLAVRSLQQIGTTEALEAVQHWWEQQVKKSKK